MVGGLLTDPPLYRQRPDDSHLGHQRSHLNPNSCASSNEHRSPSHRTQSQTSTSTQQTVRYGRTRGKGGNQASAVPSQCHIFLGSRPTRTGPKPHRGNCWDTSTQTNITLVFLYCLREPCSSSRRAFAQRLERREDLLGDPLLQQHGKLCFTFF